MNPAGAHYSPHESKGQRENAAAVGSLSSRLRRLHFAHRKFRLPLGAGSEPELIEIDDAREAVGESDNFDSVCYRSPNGQHEFSWVDNHRRCKFCGEVIE